MSMWRNAVVHTHMHCLFVYTPWATEAYGCIPLCHFDVIAVQLLLLSPVNASLMAVYLEHDPSISISRPPPLPPPLPHLPGDASVVSSLAGSLSTPGTGTD